MESSRVYWTVLCLFALTTRAVVADGSDASAATDDDAVDSESSPAVQYLQQLFRRFKESNRAFGDGEMNLLPDETKGFANTVHCFRAQNLPQGDAAEEVRLQFDFSSLRPAQNILATQLVLMVPETDFDRVLRVYEVKQNGEVLGPLSSTMTVASMAKPGTRWMEVAIRYTTEHTSQGIFSVKVKDQSETGQPSDVNVRSLLDSITSLLVVYAHDSAPNRPPTGKLDLGVQKRQASPLSLPTLSEIENEPCQRYSPFLTYAQIGWPSSFVITPAGGFPFAYCYGRCNSPFGSEIEYVRHSQLLQALNNYQLRKNQPLIPPPCCVPIRYRPQDLITLEADRHTVMHVFQDVVSCGCM